MLTTLAFTIPVMQFGGLQYARDHLQNKGINDGLSASFFVLHASPFYTIPEDFHLYVTRGKRIAERGWQGNLLVKHDPAAGLTISNPLQAGLGYIAHLTGGEPRRYATFLVVLISIAWLCAVGTAVSLFGPKLGVIPVALFTILVLTLLRPTKLAILFSGFLPMLDPQAAASIWPGGRALRFSTFGWSLPLLMTVTMFCCAAAVRFKESRAGLFFIPFATLLFALGDVWSLQLSIVILGLATLARAALLRGAPRNGESLLRRWLTDRWLRVFVLSAVASVLVFVALGAPQHPDVVARSGMGPIWHGSIGRVLGPGDIARLGRPAFTLVFLLTFAIALWLRPRRDMLAAGAIGLLPLAATWLLVLAMAVYGADSVQVQQFDGRSIALAFLSMCLMIGNSCRVLLARLANGERGRLRRLLLSAQALSLAILLAFSLLHTLRISIFVNRYAARDYALSREVEQLKADLVSLSRLYPNASLATLSHEINYVAMESTPFDLLLPEGFPLHNAGSNDSIARDAAAILKFYGATTTRWNEFSTRQHPRDQASWQTSRLDSERDGYCYYLFHRLEGHASRGDNIFDCNREVAARLGNAPAIRPDIVVLDETSDFLGRPSLNGYWKQAQYGSVEVWVRDGLKPER